MKTIYYIAAKTDFWHLLGYDESDYSTALKKAKEVYPNATEYRHIGEGNYFPVSDQAVIIAEALLNITK